MRRFVQCIAGLTVAACGAIAFQQNAPPRASIEPGNVYGVINVVRTVANLDQSIAFWRDAYGLEVKSQDMLSQDDRSFQKLAGVTGARTRHAVLGIPGTTFGIELLEFTGIKNTPVHLRLQDTGSTNIFFRVRNIDETLAAAKKLGASVVTMGGEPMETKNANTHTSLRSMFIYDPEGLLYEVAQNYPEQESKEPADSKVLAATFTETSAYSDSLVAFYKALGVELKAGNPAPWTAFREALTGTGHTSLKSSPLLIPQSPDRWGILEYAESDGKPFHANIQDPGVSMVSLRVHDAAAAATAAKAAGGTVISTGGEAVKMARGGTRVILRAPDGFFLELIQE